MSSRQLMVIALAGLVAACSGKKGDPGDKGGTVLLVTEDAGANCPAGGTAVRSGLDRNHNGVLDAAEVTSTAYICNGSGGAGLTSLVAMEPEGVGTNCPTAGTAIHTGLDDDGDDFLDPAEVDATSYVCNGADGADGVTSLVAVTAAPIQDCPAGGLRIAFGLDTSGDGTLGALEERGSSVVCNGADGANGVTSLVKMVTIAPGGAQCAATGGTRIASGRDVSGNGLLEAGEETSIAYICNGAAGPQGPQGDGALVRLTPEPPGSNCPAGGQMVEVGSVDAAGVETVTATDFVCSGANRYYLVSSAPWGGQPPNGCERGGARIESFVDTNANGIFDADVETVDSTQYVCNVYLGQIAAGFNTTCATVSDGTVRCWGLSYEDLVQTSSVPVALAGVASATAVVSGYLHSCALLLDTSVVCWGDNSAAQLGSDPNVPDGIVYSATPVAVMTAPDAPLTGVAALSAAGFQTCALLLDGSIACWGDDLAGAYNAAPTAIALPAGTFATGVAAGGLHACAVVDDGVTRGVACWGDNTSGQLGVDPVATPSSAVPVSPALADVVEVAAGSDFTCALLLDTSVFCWGDELEGRLGFDDGEPFTFQPGGLGPTAAVFGAVGVSAGFDHACATLEDGTIACWGSNVSGQLGNGVPSASEPATLVAGLSSARSVTAGMQYTCAVLTDGNARCWGFNELGQLGDGSYATRYAPSAVVTSLAP
jgi:alpha-tubulin suppressor-like RCC1 family protein